MKIAVYCASAPSNNPNFIKLTKELGLELGKKHSLVYGGAKSGLMNEIADGFLASGGRVTGVIPNIHLIMERTKEGLSDYIYTETMAKRRIAMMDLADCYIALPGGPGTLDELSEIMDEIRIKELKKFLIIYNMDHFYDEFEQYVNKYYQYELLKKDDLKDVYFVRTLDEILQIIDKYENKSSL